MCREFFQMAGRAGRRGMDPDGDVYVRVNPHEVALPDVLRVVHGRPEPVRSRFNTAYATLLNLYRRYQRKLLEIYPKTFHHFQASAHQRHEGVNFIERKLTLLSSLGYLEEQGLTPKGEFASWMYGYELMLSELHAQGVLNDLSDVWLNVLLIGLVFEPRRGMVLTRPHHMGRKLEAACEPIVATVHRLERKLRVYPRTKVPQFHLAAAMEAWSQGGTFDKVVELAGVDEGELVRYFRMVIQLLRQLSHAPVASEPLRAVASQGLKRINRDVVDAEQQLRRG